VGGSPLGGGYAATNPSADVDVAYILTGTGLQKLP
jgi:hypothetical protein